MVPEETVTIAIQDDNVEGRIEIRQVTNPASLFVVPTSKQMRRELEYVGNEHDVSIA